MQLSLGNAKTSAERDLAIVPFIYHAIELLISRSRLRIESESEIKEVYKSTL